MLIRLLMGALAAQAADPPPLDLSALLREAEAAHPAIAAARSREAAARAAAVREGAPPDPIASIAYTNVGFGGGSLGDDEESVVELSWSQEWPYPGKLRLAGEAARLEAETLGHEAELARLEIAAGVKKAYTELWHADQTAAVLRESRELLSSLAETAQRRYETGEGLLENVLKAQTEIARLDAELQKAAQERRAAEALINTLTGRATGTPLGVAADLPRPAEVDAEALERAALAVSPRLRAREAATRRREAQLDLARRDLRPDFAWGAAYGHRGRLDPEITGEFGVRVPLHRQRRQAAAVTEASHRLDSARHEIETERRRISAMVRDLASRARLAAELEILYANAIVPRAQSALESAASSYGVGRIDFLALLSDVNDLLAHRLELITQQHERILALADLEPITGRMLAQPGEAP